VFGGCIWKEQLCDNVGKLLQILLRVLEMKQELPRSKICMNIQAGVGSFVGFECPTAVLLKIQDLWLLNCVNWLRGNIILKCCTAFIVAVQQSNNSSCFWSWV